MAPKTWIIYSGAPISAPVPNAECVKRPEPREYPRNEPILIVYTDPDLYDDNFLDLALTISQKNPKQSRLFRVRWADPDTPHPHAPSAKAVSFLSLFCQVPGVDDVSDLAELIRTGIR